jgi:hypothetical protein
VRNSTGRNGRKRMAFWPRRVNPDVVLLHPGYALAVVAMRNHCAAMLATNHELQAQNSVRPRCRSAPRATL